MTLQFGLRPGEYALLTAPELAESADSQAPASPPLPFRTTTTRRKLSRVDLTARQFRVTWDWTPRRGWRRKYTPVEEEPMT